MAGRPRIFCSVVVLCILRRTVRSTEDARICLRAMRKTWTEGGGGGPGLVEAQLLLVVVPGVVVLARVEVGVKGRRPGRGRLVVVVGAGGAALGVGHPRLVPRGVLLLLLSPDSLS